SHSLRSTIPLRLTIGTCFSSSRCRLRHSAGLSGTVRLHNVHFILYCQLSADGMPLSPHTYHHRSPRLSLWQGTDAGSVWPLPSPSLLLALLPSGRATSVAMHPPPPDKQHSFTAHCSFPFH